MPRAALALLLALPVLASSQLVIQYDVGPGGAAQVHTYMRIVNMTGDGVRVVESSVPNQFPPFVRVEYSVSYGGTAEGEVVYADRVDVVVRAYSLLPVPVPLFISVTAGEGLAVTFSRQPSMVTSVGGSTTYYWSTLLVNYTELRLGIRVRDFGSFGAVRLPPIVASSTVDLRAIMEANRERMAQIREGLSKIEPLLRAVDNFTDTAQAQLQSLAQLAQLLNATGIAMRQGSRALNASSLLVEALNGQLSALADAASAAAEVVNRSRLLVDYQYAALMTAAEALRTQAVALEAYEDAAGRYAGGFRQAAASLMSAREGLLRISAGLTQAISALAEARGRLASVKLNVTPAEAAISEAVKTMDSVMSLLLSARDSTDAAARTIADTAAALLDMAQVLDETRESLGRLSLILNQTSYSTQTNATELRRNMPSLLTNATLQLSLISRSLRDAAAQVSGYLSPIRQAAEVLAQMGDRLSTSAGDLMRYRAERLAALPQLGYFKSMVINYSQSLDTQLRELEAQNAALARLLSMYNATEVEVLYVRRLPVAASPAAIANLTMPKLVQVEPKRDNAPQTAAAVGVAAAAAAAALLLKRFVSSSSR